ncbi:MAG: hypothetical protein ACLFUG_08745 [Nitriliruptoraceae bacterium]
MSARGGPLDPYLALEDDARQAAEAAARGERTQRLQRASEVATWVGTLEDLAERRLPVVVQLAGGRSVRGQLVASEPDLLALRGDAGQLVVVRSLAVRMLRPRPEVPAAVAAGDRRRLAGRRFVEVLEELTEERAVVQLGIEGLEAPLAGALRALGEDVLTLELASEPRSLVYLPLLAVQEVAIGP